MSCGKLKPMSKPCESWIAKLWKWFMPPNAFDVIDKHLPKLPREYRDENGECKYCYGTGSLIFIDNEDTELIQEAVDYACGPVMPECPYCHGEEKCQI